MRQLTAVEVLVVVLAILGAVTLLFGAPTFTKHGQGKETQIVVPVEVRDVSQDRSEVERLERLNKKYEPWK
jgi:hypothetical protein